MTPNVFIEAAAMKVSKWYICRIQKYTSGIFLQGQHRSKYKTPANSVVPILAQGRVAVKWWEAKRQEVPVS